MYCVTSNKDQVNRHPDLANLSWRQASLDTAVRAKTDFQKRCIENRVKVETFDLDKAKEIYVKLTKAGCVAFKNWV